LRPDPSGAPASTAAASRRTGKTREILGCHILGTDASTPLQGVSALMRADETVDAVRRAIFVHPALPEVVQRASGELELD